ncbi:MAG: thiol peroxidase [Candidatus Zixiibacteriota bacterium]
MIDMPVKRKGAVTMRGNSVTLIGPELKIGAAAPEFNLAANDLSSVTLSGSAGKTRLLIIVPSLDTPTCELETVQFNRRLAELSDDFVVYVISKDLPFAQTRFCGAQDVTNLQTLSAYRDDSFGRDYGVLMEGNHLLARAIFIVGPDGEITYVQLVGEVADEPDYDEALDALGVRV